MEYATLDGIPAIAIDPKNFEARWSLGRALILSERFEEAVETLQVVVALDPQRAERAA